MMFQNPFSLKGRICRTEFWFSCFIYAGLISMFFITMEPLSNSASSIAENGIMLLILGPCFWLLCVQGAKRFHDLGKSGWGVINPYNFFLLFFQKGQVNRNQYGVDPRSVRDQFFYPSDEVTDGFFYEINKEDIHLN